MAIVIHVSNVSARVFPKELLASANCFPEIAFDGFPYTPKEIIAEGCHTLLCGKPIVTTSEHLILFALFCVRNSHEPEKITPLFCMCEDLHIFYHSKDKTPRRLKVDESGEFLDRFPDGFFRERENLLF